MKSFFILSVSILILIAGCAKKEMLFSHHKIPSETINQHFVCKMRIGNANHPLCRSQAQKMDNSFAQY